MFRCQHCNTVGDRQTGIVTKIRKVTYRLKIKIIRTEVLPDATAIKENISYNNLKPRYGTEIAQELKVCKKCVPRLKDTKPRIVESVEKEVIVKTLVNPRNFNSRRKRTDGFKKGFSKSNSEARNHGQSR